MAVSGSISIKVNATESGTNDFGTPQWAGALAHSLSFSNGTGANQINLVWFDERTLASNTAEDIDIAGSLTMALGTAFVAAEVVAIAVINAPKTGTANSTNLTIGGDTASFEGFLSADGTIGPIGPGGFFIMASPNASGLGTVTATTADIIQIANSSGAAATYQVAIFARTA